VSVRSVWWHDVIENCRLNCQNSVRLWPSNMDLATTELHNFDRHATSMWDSGKGGKHRPRMPLRMDRFRCPRLHSSTSGRKSVTKRGIYIIAVASPERDPVCWVVAQAQL
jgi:hypothetical protein